MDIHKIQYRFRFSDDQTTELELHLRTDSMLSVGWVPAHPPEWTALENHKCSNCPLSVEQNPFCPAALALTKLVDDVGHMDLLDTVNLQVLTAGRSVVQNTTVQKALASFIGLLMATSGCPRAAFFRPLAKFHYPLASESETMFRSLTVFLLAEYYLHKQGREAKFDIDGLFAIYGELETVNSAIAERLIASGDKVAAQCMKEWDVFSGMFPLRVEELLNELQPLFDVYLTD